MKTERSFRKRMIHSSMKSRKYLKKFKKDQLFNESDDSIGKEQLTNIFYRTNVIYTHILFIIIDEIF